MSFSAATVVSENLAALNAASTGDLVFWTADDLYAWMDEALKKLARTSPVFVDLDASLVASDDTAVYANPARHVSLIAFIFDGVFLRPASSRELAALSDTWQTDSQTPTRWIQDWEGHDFFRLYPTPAAGDAGKLIEIVLARYPADISSGSPTIAAPRVVGDYLALRMIAEARRADTDGALPEVATHLDQQCALYEQVFAAYWGTP